MDTAIFHSLVGLFDLIDYVHMKVVEFFLNTYPLEKDEFSLRTG